jgi:CubicO group peptidase (beta-lactamase class C family)
MVSRALKMVLSLTIIVEFTRLLQLHGTTSMNTVCADDSAWNQLDKFVERLMTCHSIPGLVLTVVKLSDNGVPSVTQKQFGWADIGRQKPMTEHTRMCIASLTKAFSATLLGLLLTDSE